MAYINQVERNNLLKSAGDAFMVIADYTTTDTIFSDRFVEARKNYNALCDKLRTQFHMTDADIASRMAFQFFNSRVRGVQNGR